MHIPKICLVGWFLLKKKIKQLNNLITKPLNKKWVGIWNRKRARYCHSTAPINNDENNNPKQIEMRLKLTVTKGLSGPPFIVRRILMNSTVADE